MTLDEMIIKKKELGYSYQYISEQSGVPLGTVQKVFGGSTASPRQSTLKALSRLFEETVSYDILSEAPNPTDIVKETSSYGYTYGSNAIKADSYEGKTLEDYLALPEGTRIEMIDGVFYDMAAPSALHQELMLILAMLLKEHVRKKHGGCKVFAAPYDVQLDCDDRTMVEPDVMVICDVKKVTMRCCFGAPDLVMEILSPATRRRDLTLKASKYENAGVREYWVIDPKEEKLIVYDFAGDKFPAIYNFTMQVPVGIWNGELQIDFRKIREELAYLYDAGDTEEE